MGQVGNHLFSDFSGAQSCALFNAGTDIFGPANAFNVVASGATVFPEVQDLTAGDLTNRLGNIRFVRPTNGHTYGVCTSSRYTGLTQIWDTGSQTSNYDQTQSFTFYDQRFGVSNLFNVQFNVSIGVGNGAYAHTVTIKIDGTTQVNTGASGNFQFLLAHGSHSIEIIMGIGISTNNGEVVTFAAQ